MNGKEREMLFQNLYIKLNIHYTILLKKVQAPFPLYHYNNLTPSPDLDPLVS